MLSETEVLLEAPPRRDLVAPNRFLWIVLPYAIYIGFVTNGGVSLLLRRAGMPAYAVAQAIGWLGVPSTIYFLWSPLADMGMPRRAWYMAATVGAGAALALGSVMLGRDPVAAVWIFFAGLVFCMLISSAYGGLMAAMLSPAGRTRGSAWAQASNLGGGAVGPGLILWLALHFHRTVGGVPLWVPAAALLLVVPGLTVLGLREPRRQASATFGAHWRRVGQELRLTCLEPKNFFGLLLLLAPPGAAALMGLLSTISPSYGVADSAVVWINGIGGGLLLAAGCMAGAWVKKIDRRIAYGLAAALVALPAFWLAFGPATPRAYLWGTVVYLFTVGIASTLSMDLVLDVVGAVGESGSLRYSILSAMSYVPIAYMSWIEGWAEHRWGYRGMPAVEAVSSLVDLPLIAGWLWWRRQARRG